MSVVSIGRLLGGFVGNSVDTDSWIPDLAPDT